MGREGQPSVGWTFGHDHPDYRLLEERAALHLRMSPGKIARHLLEERLELHRAGWVEGDTELRDILLGVIALDEAGRDMVKDVIREALSNTGRGSRRGKRRVKKVNNL